MTCTILEKKNMEKRTLTVEEICAIIKICGEHGVDTFEYEGLKLGFKDNSPVVTNVTSDFFQGQKDNSPTEPFNEDTGVKADEFDVKFDQFADAALEDPMLFEEIMANEDRMDELLDELGALDA